MAKAETIRSGMLGKVELRLAKRDCRFFGLVDGVIKLEGDVADEVWRQLHDEAGKSNPKFFGFDGARARFSHWFPGGFRSLAYLRDERDYKVAAKKKLDEGAPLEHAVTGSGFGEAVWSVFQTNLFSRFEKMRVRDALRGPMADSLIRAAARFAIGETKAALPDLERILKPYDSAKWTVVTYLPFLWRPENHMFLKPEVTQDFAARVGHRFASDYEPRLRVSVYESLLDLPSKTAAELAELQPRDRIDVQSFIWVVGAYREEPQKPLPLS
jgi:hypothetical protein